MTINPPASRTVLEIRGLAKSFGPHKVLDSIDLSVAAGEVVCLVGPSGAGKSTLLRCINWLDAPDSGSISLLGADVCARPGRSVPERKLDALRRQTAMVFQNFALWPHLTVLQNVMLSPLHVQKRPYDLVRGEAENLLERVGLSDKHEALPSQLSGGQKQRVGIARALAVRTPLLLFDEPTSALDPERVGEVLNVIRELAREHMTMLLVTHEIGFARDISDRMVFLENGRILEDADTARFFSPDMPARVRQFLSRHEQAVRSHLA